MAILLQRAFEVAAPLERAWDHLAQVTKWPSWAQHIKRIELSPDESLGAASSGAIVLTNGIRSTFRMVEFDRPQNMDVVGTVPVVDGGL